jgi:hypothetical protein
VLHPRVAVEPMVEGFGRQGGVGVDQQEAVVLDQPDAVACRGLRRRSGDLARGLVGDHLDHAKPLGDGQGPDGGHDLVDGHRRRMPCPGPASTEMCTEAGDRNPTFAVGRGQGGALHAVRKLRCCRTVAWRTGFASRGGTARRTSR